MRQTAIAAMLCSVIVGKKHTTASLALKGRMDTFAKHANTLQWDWIPLPPDRACHTWPVTDDECLWQWDEWMWYCEDNWTPMCQRVAEEFYSQDLDWHTPVRPEERCAVAPLEMDDDC